MTRRTTILRGTCLVAALVVGVLLYASIDRIRERLALDTLEAGNPMEREHAVRTLAEVGTERAAGPLIRSVVEARVPPAIAAAALIEIGPPASTALVDVLASPELELRRFATEALLQIDPDEFGPIADSLRGLLEDRVRESVWHLAQLPAPPEAAVAALEGLANDPWREQEEGIDALGHIGPAARRALPTIEALMEGDDVRAEHAAIAFARITLFEPERALPRLVALLDGTTDSFKRRRVLRAIAILGPGSRPALDRVVEEPDGDGVVEVLRHMRPSWADLRPHLPALLAKVESVVCCDSAAVFATHGAAADDLTRLASSEDSKVRSNALEALARVGSRARRAVPTLLDLVDSEGLRTESERTDRELAAVFGAIGPAAADALPFCLQRLGPSGAERSRFEVTDADAVVAAIGPVAVPPLRDALHAEDTQLRVAAAMCLGAIGPAARAAIPDLVAALSQSEDVELRHATLFALRCMGPAAAEAATERLRELLDDPEVWRSAAAALFEIDTAPATPIDALLPCAVPPSWRDEPRALRPGWLDRYPEFVPSAEQVLDELADPRRVDLAAEMLERRPELAADAAIVAAVADLQQSEAPADVMAVALNHELLQRFPAVRDAAVRDLARRYDECKSRRLDCGVIVGRLCVFERPEEPIAAVLTDSLARRDLAACLDAARWLWRHERISIERLITVLVAALQAPILRPGRGYLPSLRHAAASALGDLGPAAAVAVTRLQATLLDPEAELRAQCALALWRIEGEEWYRRVVTELEAFLRERAVDPVLGEPVRRDMGWALEALGPRAIADLAPLLADADEQVRIGMLVSLRARGVDARSVRPAIVERLADEHFRVREEALRTLRAIGVTSEEAARLVGLAVHDDPFVRDIVAEALRELSGDGRD